VCDSPIATLLVRRFRTIGNDAKGVTLRGDALPD
jgi:hypothetical protein